MIDSRQRRTQHLKKREEGFVNRWQVNAKRRTYDALQDQHSSYYFVLPSVKEHMRRLKRVITMIIKAIKRQFSSEADRLARSIDRKLKDIRQSKQLSQRIKDKKHLVADSFSRHWPQKRTDVLRNHFRKVESSLTQHSVSKNQTEQKLPALCKTHNQNHYASCERIQQSSFRKKLTPSQTKKKPIVVEHVIFQKFLEEKKQQVLRKSMGTLNTSPQK